jgi:hypothetical protein
MTGGDYKGREYRGLSDELLVEILKFASIGVYDESQELVDTSKWLLDVSLCSRRMNSLTEPILYTQLKESGDRLPKFLARILVRPDLARCVRIYHGTAMGSEIREEFLDVSDLVEDDWERIRTAVHRAGSHADWYHALECGNWDAMTALMFHLLPNVQELKFSRWSYTKDVYPFIYAALERPLLGKLWSVYIKYWDTENGLNLDQLVPFLKIPSVSTFKGYMISDGAWGGEPVLSNIKDLSLNYSNLDTVSLKNFLRCFPQLEKLFYRNGGAYVGYSEFEAPGAMEALEHLKPCLEELHILQDENGDMWDGKAFGNGSFSDFRKLSRLDISTSILLDGEGLRLIDCIPPSLEYLSLREVEARHVEQILELVSQRSLILDLQWEGVVYPDKPSPPGPILHPGFTTEEAGKLQSLAEILIRRLPPKLRYVQYLEMPKEPAVPGWPIAPISVSHIFHYPYEGYEELCEEKGCDPKTGLSPDGIWRFASGNAEVLG